jgi:hypothetical protein
MDDPRTLAERRAALNSDVKTLPLSARTTSPSRLARPPPAKRKTDSQNRAARRAAASMARRATVERTAHGIEEFCWANGFSRAMFYKLRAQGLAPATFRVGRHVLISVEEAARWRKEQTARAREETSEQA